MKRILQILLTLTVLLYTVNAHAQLVHKVMPGETFASIAGRYGITESQLRSSNPQYKTYAQCYVGMTLNLPVARTGNVTAESDAPYTEIISTDAKQEVPDEYEDDGTGGTGFFSATYDFTDIENVSDAWGLSFVLGGKNYILRNLYTSYGVGLRMGFASNVDYKSSSYTLHLPVNVGASFMDRWLEIGTGPGFDVILSSKTKLDGEVVYDLADDENSSRFGVTWGFNVRLMKMIKFEVNISLQKGSAGKLAGMSLGFEF